MGDFKKHNKEKTNYLDKDKYSLSQRKKFYKESIKSVLNPFREQDFDRETFDPLAEQEIKDVSFRKRKDVPKVLPTFGLKPKEIMEGQMIGMYESKQDLYLIMAHRINQLQEEIELLKTKIK